MRFFVMFVTAVCMLFLNKLRWPKKKNFYENYCVRLNVNISKFIVTVTSTVNVILTDIVMFVLFQTILIRERFFTGKNVNFSNVHLHLIRF